MSHLTVSDPVALNARPCGQADCRWRPQLQEWFHEEGVMLLAVSLLRDTDTQGRLKGLLCVSCMVRGYAPALVSFCQDHQGLSKLLPLVCFPGDAAARGCCPGTACMLAILSRPGSNSGQSIARILLVGRGSSPGMHARHLECQSLHSS